MNKIKFKLADIRKNIAYRPQGYYDDVVSKGVVYGDYVEMDQDEALKLLEKYTEKNPVRVFQAQYYSRLGTPDELEKSHWGPILWKEFHSRTEQYEGDPDTEHRWLKIFASWLPCGECRQHFQSILRMMPPDLSSKKSYVAWGVKVHNKVNQKLGKPPFKPSRSYLAQLAAGSPPTLLNQLTTFSKASVGFAKSGFKTTPPEVLADREAICRACPEWDAKALNGTGRCKKCGCSTWAKLRMATERCPLGKWEAVPLDKESTPEQETANQ